MHQPRCVCALEAMLRLSLWLLPFWVSACLAPQTGITCRLWRHSARRHGLRRCCGSSISCCWGFMGLYGGWWGHFCHFLSLSREDFRPCLAISCISGAALHVGCKPLYAGLSALAGRCYAVPLRSVCRYCRVGWACRECAPCKSTSSNHSICSVSRHMYQGTVEEAARVSKQACA